MFAHTHTHTQLSARHPSVEAFNSAQTECQQSKTVQEKRKPKTGSTAATIWAVNFSQLFNMWKSLSNIKVALQAYWRARSPSACVWRAGASTPRLSAAFPGLIPPARRDPRSAPGPEALTLAARPPAPRWPSAPLGPPDSRLRNTWEEKSSHAHCIKSKVSLPLGTQSDSIILKWLWHPENTFIFTHKNS